MEKLSRFEINTERLFLKPLDTGYLNTTNEYALDYENTKYMMYLPNENAEETLAFLKNTEAEWEKEQPDFYEFAILLNDIHIGAVCIYFEDGAGELGWILNHKYWRKGFAYEAAKAVMDYFSDKGTTHFIAHCDTENAPSYKLMEKLGMARTSEHGGRRNRAAAQDSREYRYELCF